MDRKVIIGSRGSDLALWQANYVKNQLAQLNLDTELRIIKTKGDLIKDLSFDKIEGKGFFTKEIEEALLNNSIDLAVHSHKDLETNPPKGLVVAAVSEREDPSELLLIRQNQVDNTKFWSLKEGAVVGTSSSRRKSQMKLFRSNVVLKDLRGNVPTRIQKLREGQYDAIIIANAGVSRLQLDISDLHSKVLPNKWMIPAPAQGVLGIQVRETDNELISILKKINSVPTQRNIEFERKVLNLMNGGCQLPLGVYCETDNNVIKAWISMASSFNEIPYRIYKEGSNPKQIVEQFVREEALYRRALDYGFDQGDYVIRRRLVQKMDFMAEGLAMDHTEIADDALKGHYLANLDDYTESATISFAHVFYSFSKNGEVLAASKSSALQARLNADQVTLENASRYGDRFPYHVNYVEKTREQIRDHFGLEMARDLFALPVNRQHWQGNFKSDHGNHLVLKVDHTPARVLKLTEVEGQVRVDLRNQIKSRNQKKYVNEVLEDYQVKIEPGLLGS